MKILIVLRNKELQSTNHVILNRAQYTIKMILYGPSHNEIIYEFIKFRLLTFATFSPLSPILTTS